VGERVLPWANLEFLYPVGYSAGNLGENFSRKERCDISPAERRRKAEGLGIPRERLATGVSTRCLLVNA